MTTTTQPTDTRRDEEKDCCAGCRHGYSWCAKVVFELGLADAMTAALNGEAK
jgi:hypothetical protein